MKPALTPVAEALDILLSETRAQLSTQSVALSAMVGRVLAEDIVAQINVPPQDNSAMDGYALRSADVAPGKLLPVSQRIQAGHLAAPLQAGTAARIFTGATIPAGADAVVMQEDCTADEGSISINDTVQPEQHIRPRGQDIAQGATVVRAGERLQAATVGVIASVGQAQAVCYRRLRVAILSTGDELLEPGVSPVCGSENNANSGGAGIFNSNRYTLHALLTRLDCEIVDAGIIPDDHAKTRNIISSLAGSVDCIISSGGVSVGEADYIKAVLEELGELRLWKLAMKPGKPLSYGVVHAVGGDKTVFFGLPGNPSAVMATFSVIVRPCLLKLQGQEADLLPPTIPARALFEWPRPGTRQEYLRARYRLDTNGEWEVDIYSNQSSGVLSSASWANCFAIVPIGVTIKKGEQLAVLPFSFSG